MHIRHLGNNYFDPNLWYKRFFLTPTKKWRMSRPKQDSGLEKNGEQTNRRAAMEEGASSKLKVKCYVVFLTPETLSSTFIQHRR